MWYIETRNGGRYTHVGSEYLAPKELQSILDCMTKQGLKPYVHYVEYEYNGYSSRVSIINDETLEEVFVHHHIVWEHSGTSYFQVRIWENYDEAVLWDSRYGYTADKIQEVMHRAKTLSLPVISEEDMLFRQVDILHREIFGTPAEDPRIKYPCSAKDLMEIDLKCLKQYKEKRYQKDFDIDKDIILEDDVIVL